MTPPTLDWELDQALLSAGFGRTPFDAALVLGSGLSEAADFIEFDFEAPYGALPSLGPTEVPGHRGILRAGVFEGLKVLVFCGRRHFYESGSMAQAAITARIAAHLGAKLFLTVSAVGSVYPEIPVGSHVFITDHINLMGTNPLCGVSDEGGPPFLDLSAVYRGDLLDGVGEKLGEDFTLHRGILAAFSGPTYETPAEVRMAKLLGASIVGMSTVPEVVWARYLGMEVAAYGRVSNLASGLNSHPLTHAEVLDSAKEGTKITGAVIRATLRAWMEDRGTNG